MPPASGVRGRYQQRGAGEGGLVGGEGGAAGWGEAVGAVGVEGRGVVGFEGEGDAGAPDAFGVASVWLVGVSGGGWEGGGGGGRIRMLF